MKKWVNLILRARRGFLQWVLGPVIACALQTTGLGFVITNANDQITPAVTANGNDYLVAWVDPTSAGSIYGARVNSSGVLTDSTNIGPLRYFYTSVSPSVASNGRDSLLVWRSLNYLGGEMAVLDIGGAFVPRDGVVRIANTFLVWGHEDGNSGDVLNYPSVASCGGNYLTVWWEHWPQYYPPISVSGVRGQRVTSSGPIGSVFTLDVGGDSPKIAGGSTNYLVVWQAGGDIFAATVGTNSGVSDPIPISTGAWLETAPSVAFGNNEFLVVWADNRNSISDVYGARVTPAGVVLDPDGIPISTQANYEGSPSVASDGMGFLVVWLDQDSTSGTASLFGAHVSDTGVVLDPNRIPIATLANSETVPVVACNGANYLVVWADYNGVTGQDIFGAQVATYPPTLRFNHISFDANGVSLSWSALTGRTYRVQCTADPGSRVWADLAGDVAATNNVASKVDAGALGSTQRFYRVIQLPSP